ncbi:HNH endonuclease [Compostibacter hankyongensis]|uniref:NUMOD4 domain-containing protein n=1 Tax=Compostibacter hankyongensis TaxID=1007089 RepID=A0ABP8G5A0_9BACT
MIKLRKNEEWKELPIKYKSALRKKYAVSSQGRVVSYTDRLEEGTLLNGSTVEGYTVINVKPNDTFQSLYLHRELARLFLTRPGRTYKYVIHLDHDKKNNNIRNLRWATKREMEEHQQNSPAKKAYKERQRNRTRGLKLTLANVKAIKRQLQRPGRKTMRQIAERFGISEMQLYRIKSGENWSHVTVD